MRMTEAISEFGIAKAVEGYAESTVKGYQWRLNQLSDWLSNPQVDRITLSDLRDFIYYLRKEYKTRRWDGDASPLTEASIHGYWKAFRCFWNWLHDDYDLENVAQKLKMPRYTLRPIAPYTKEEILMMLEACDRDAAEHNRSTRIRDRAVLLLLLDTGLRLGELMRLKVRDVDIEGGKITVLPYGRGIKSSGRMVYLGISAKRAMKKYLEQIPKQPETSLFSISNDGMRNLVRRIGKRCGVNAWSHKFRHTFAINYLRNGGDVFTLQRQLGHSTLDMVQHYLAIADTDSQAAHQKASPADRWQLYAD